MKQTKVLFLIEKPEGNLPCDVFAYFPEERYNSIEPHIFTCYAHIGQHSGCHKDYAAECKEAEYSEYYDLLRELIGQGYKNLLILNKRPFTCNRKPTPAEIKFGEGATHYRDFTIAEIGINKTGQLKRWFIADDGLRYYTR